MTEATKIEFIKKRYRYENISRINFFLKNKDLIYKNANDENIITAKLQKLQKEADEANQKLRNQLLHKKEEKLPEIVKTDNLKEYAKNLEKLYKDLGDGRCLTNTMRKVPIRQLNLLYSNFEGRKAYFNDRYRLRPDQKFYFPETTSYEYGWKMMNLPKANTDDKHYGREFSLKHFVYRKNGPCMFQKKEQSLNTNISTSL